jgi:pyruvate dehydrogenase (quinone)
LFKDVAGEYVYMASSPVQIRQLVDRAMRIATTERSVTCIIPKDVQEMDAVEQPPHTANTVHTGVGYSTPHVVPSEADLQHAADILNAGEKVAMLVGIGTKHAANEVIQVADLLGCGVAKALLGKQVLPDDLPFVTGCIGLLGTKPSYDMMMGCDTLLMIGSTFPYGQSLPKEGQARGIQIDIDGRNLSLRYPMELNLIGDNGVAIERLEVSAYTVPSDSPESDGTYAWNKTAIVIVEASSYIRLRARFEKFFLANSSILFLCNTLPRRNRKFCERKAFIQEELCQAN